MAEENPRWHHQGAALLPCSWRGSNSGVPVSKLGERPLAGARQPKVMLGICKENSAKQNRRAEKSPCIPMASPDIKAESSLFSPHRAHSRSHDSPSTLEAEGRKPQQTKHPSHVISVKAGHGEGIHLPSCTFQLWLGREGTAAARSDSVKEQERDTCLAATGEQALHKQIYGRLHPHKHP